MTDLNATGQMNMTPVNELSRTRQTIEVNSRMEPIGHYNGKNKKSFCQNSESELRKIL